MAEGYKPQEVVSPVRNGGRLQATRSCFSYEEWRKATRHKKLSLLQGMAECFKSQEVASPIRNGGRLQVTRSCFSYKEWRNALSHKKLSLL